MLLQLLLTLNVFGRLLACFSPKRFCCLCSCSLVIVYTTSGAGMFQDLHTGARNMWQNAGTHIHIYWHSSTVDAHTCADQRTNLIFQLDDAVRLALRRTSVCALTKKPAHNEKKETIKTNTNTNMKFETRNSKWKLVHYSCSCWRHITVATCRNALASAACRCRPCFSSLCYLCSGLFPHFVGQLSTVNAWLPAAQTQAARCCRYAKAYGNFFFEFALLNFFFFNFCFCFLKIAQLLLVFVSLSAS